MLGTMAIALAVLSTSSFGGTMSFYNDTESVPDNVFTAGLVDFVLTDTPFASVGSTTDWAVDVTPHELSNPFYYYASSTDFVGNDELCNALTVTATLDGQTMYSGLLSGLLTATTTVIDRWTFDFDNFENYPGQSCKFFVEYNSWQTRHGMDQGGYSDTERVMYTITVPSLLLGKVYFTDPECDEQTASSTGCNDTQTWVELYNRTDVDIDTAGWSLCSSGSCFTISDSQYIDTTIIKAGEYGIVAADPAIHTQISLPWGVTPLITDNVWFDPDLDSAGDVLQLLDRNSLVIDQLNWGVSTSTWNNYSTDFWADDSLMATTGHALARLPVGFDSNQPDDWTLLGVPTLTIDAITPSVLQVGEEVTIDYTAVNTNGLSADLRVDLYLFEVDDTLHVIELDVQNTGSYSFVMPDGLDGPIRIKPVVTSPENLLLNARAVSAYLPVASTTASASATTSNVSVITIAATDATTTASVASTTDFIVTPVAGTTTVISLATTTTTTTASSTDLAQAEEVLPLEADLSSSSPAIIEVQQNVPPEEPSTSSSTPEIIVEVVVEEVEEAEPEPEVESSAGTSTAEVI